MSPEVRTSAQSGLSDLCTAESDIGDDPVVFGTSILDDMAHLARF